jgi:hypothetical protein
MFAGSEPALEDVSQKGFHDGLTAKAMMAAKGKAITCG